MLGLAKKAGKVVDGETLIKTIQSKRVFLVFLANDASLNTQKKIKDKCQYYNVYYNTDFDADTISNAIGKSNRMAAGIIDQKMSNHIIKLLEGGGINGRIKKEEEKSNKE